MMAEFYYLLRKRLTCGGVGEHPSAAEVAADDELEDVNDRDDGALQADA